jgi:hypothetical protein
VAQALESVAGSPCRAKPLSVARDAIGTLLPQANKHVATPKNSSVRMTSSFARCGSACKANQFDVR